MRGWGGLMCWVVLPLGLYNNYTYIGSITLEKNMHQHCKDKLIFKNSEE
jgi:hypothetical protein